MQHSFRSTAQLDVEPECMRESRCERLASWKKGSPTAKKGSFSESRPCSWQEYRKDSPPKMSVNNWGTWQSLEEQNKTNQERVSPGGDHIAYNPVRETTSRVNAEGGIASISELAWKEGGG